MRFFKGSLRVHIGVKEGSFRGQRGFTFQYCQCNNTTPRCMHSLVFVTIFRNSVFLFPNYGTLTKTETAGAALNFFCISSIHFIRFYSALQLPSDCPPTALRVSFRYPLEALFMFASVIIPHFTVDIRGHSATFSDNIQNLNKIQRFRRSCPHQERTSPFLSERFVVFYLSCACKSGGNPV